MLAEASVDDVLVSIINIELMPERMASAVKITTGIGKAISATKGARMTKPRLTKFEIPIEVAAKRVGNIRGCAIHTDTKVPTTPILAQHTRKGNIHPGFCFGMKKRMLRPAKLYKA